jgi:hypothetical protein
LVLTKVFWGVFNNWQLSWYSFKTQGGFHKVVWEAVEIKLCFCVHIGIHINFNKVWGRFCKISNLLAIPWKLWGAFHKLHERWLEKMFISTKFEGSI